MHVTSTLLLSTLAVASLARGASGIPPLDSADGGIATDTLFDPSLYEQAEAPHTLERRVAELEKRLAEHDAGVKQHRDRGHGKKGLEKHPKHRQEKERDLVEEEEDDAEGESGGIEKRATSTVNAKQAVVAFNAIRAKHNIGHVKWSTPLQHVAQYDLDKYQCNTTALAGASRHLLFTDATTGKGASIAQVASVWAKTPSGSNGNNPNFGVRTPSDLGSRATDVGCAAMQCPTDSVGILLYFCKYAIPNGPQDSFCTIM